jgi:sulfur-carrier protein
MARVVLVGNLAQVTGGVAEFDLSATSVQQLFRQLGELHPALAPHLETGVAVAIDGQIYQDSLHEPIRPDSEVFLLPQIAGGSGSGLEIRHFNRAGLADLRTNVVFQDLTPN